MAGLGIRGNAMPWPCILPCFAYAPLQVCGQAPTGQRHIMVVNKIFLFPLVLLFIVFFRFNLAFAYGTGDCPSHYQEHIQDYETDAWYTITSINAYAIGTTTEPSPPLWDYIPSLCWQTQNIDIGGGTYRRCAYSCTTCPECENDCPEQGTTADTQIAEGMYASLPFCNEDECEITSTTGLIITVEDNGTWYTYLFDGEYTGESCNPSTDTNSSDVPEEEEDDCPEYIAKCEALCTGGTIDVECTETQRHCNCDLEPPPMVMNDDDNPEVDTDGDGIPNTIDPDIDGDGTPNSDDNDVDGDSTANANDDDVDGDNIPNQYDPDIDGDGIPNASDPDIDGDFYPNESDDDMDGDGTSNENDSDANGDGINDDGAETEDVDGTGINDNALLDAIVDNTRAIADNTDRIGDLLEVDQSDIDSNLSDLESGLSSAWSSKANEVQSDILDLVDNIETVDADDADSILSKFTAIIPQPDTCTPLVFSVQGKSITFSCDISDKIKSILSYFVYVCSILSIFAIVHKELRPNNSGGTD